MKEETFGLNLARGFAFPWETSLQFRRGSHFVLKILSALARTAPGSKAGGAPLRTAALEKELDLTLRVLFSKEAGSKASIWYRQKCSPRL